MTMLKTLDRRSQRKYRHHSNVLTMEDIEAIVKVLEPVAAFGDIQWDPEINARTM
jgi:hypothetical protein